MSEAILDRRPAQPDASGDLTASFESYRRELTGLAYRMLGSAFDAEDAVQETFVRAWQGASKFEGRAALRTWLYRIATNVCLTMLETRKRRVRPIDLGPSQEPIEANLRIRPGEEWLEPIPDAMVVEPDPAEVAESRESIRLAFVAALQQLPPRQRAVLILCEVLQWKAAEVAELLETSVASVNSALQRARATLAAQPPSLGSPSPGLSEQQKALVAQFAEAFQRYDVEALTKLIRTDARQSMPPYDLWLLGRDDILAWWFGPGITCRGSRLIPVSDANGRPAFGHYRPSRSGQGYEPWSVIVLEPTDSGIAEFTFFLDTDRLFPLFGLAPRLDA
jgi:RNA polymerase sigma-70 factor (ECF subfamily)